jgi:DNA-binding LacI/PurR family transcriptional regulator
MTTMKDVAEAAGVSMITVSRVINSPELVKESTRKKVEEAMKQLDFLPNYAAKALAENSTRAIHLYVPRYMRISEPFIMNLIAGISEELSNAYYLFLIRRDLEFNQRCDGVIVMGLNLSEEKIIKSKLNVPFVLFGQTEFNIDCIDIDNLKGAYSMTEHIISSGHSKIGFLMLRSEQRYALERLEGYKEALIKNNISFDEKLVRYVDNMERDSFARSMELLEEERPSAVFCCNDFIAVSAFRAAESLRLKVPEDLSIAGFDGLTYDLVAHKPLTTVRQPVYEAGRQLARRLLERLKNPDMPFEKRLINPELVLRGTVASK